MTYRRSQGRGQSFGGRRGGGIGITLLLGLGFAAFTLIKYCSTATYNEITGEKQYISITPDQEVQLGLQSLPHMVQRHGGLHPDPRAQEMVTEVGENLLKNSPEIATMGYQFDFHYLADPNTVNAFALPGGQVFITDALASRLQNKDQLAGVIGHEIGHVVARHGAQRMSKSELIQGLTGAAVLASGDYGTAQALEMIGSVINMKYGRDQELQSDDLGVKYMIMAGYEPQEMKGVMKILKEASGGGSKQPEFFSTHPDPENRMEKIEESIQKYKDLKDGGRN